MEDFIDSRWVDAIDIGFNESIAKNASKIVKECEKNKIEPEKSIFNISLVRFHIIY